MNAVPPSAAVPVVRHTLLDDAQAVLSAVVLVSLGLALMKHAGLMTGGTPGLAFLLSYGVGWPLGVALFVVNLPFYLLAWRGLGLRFMLRSLLCVSALALGVEVVSRMVDVRSIEPLYAAVAGGLLIGTGLLILFRHGASLGGVNVLALLLQRRRGWSAGAVQLGVDTAIAATAFAVLPPRQVAWSLLGGLVLNAVLLFNHRPGRYAVPPGA